MTVTLKSKPDKPLPDVARLKSLLFLTRAQVASWLNIDEKTVANLHRFKRLRGCMIGKRLLWKPADVERFAAETQPED